jgi:hypothetical protein
LVSEEQWNRIEPRLPTDVGGVERADDRGVINGGQRLPVGVPDAARTRADAYGA